MAGFSLITAGAAVILGFLLHLLVLRRRSIRLPPGPKPWPIIGNLLCLSRELHQSLSAIARQYGPLIYLKLGDIDAVVASSSSMAEQLLKFHDANFLARPQTTFSKYVLYDNQDLVFSPYGQRWRMLRKISTLHMLSATATDEFRCVREKEVGELVGALARNNEDATVKMVNLVNVCIMNVIGRMALGRRVFKDVDNIDEFKSMVLEASVLAGELSIDDFFHALKWMNLNRYHTNKMKKLHKRLDAFFTEIVDEQYKSGDRHHCLLNTLLSLKEQSEDDNDMRLTQSEINALLMDMFMAGTDTSLSTVEWALAELIRQPKIMAQLQQELDLIVSHDHRLVSDSDLPQLAYLQAVVKETLRLHPPSSLILRMTSKSCEINGYLIPKNSFLFVNVWAIGRDPNVWDDPLEFRPERFLPGGDKAHVDVKGSDFEMIPFGVGRRSCVGINLGLRMVQLLIATLVQAFDWELPDGNLAEQLNMDEAYGLALRRARPLDVNPRPRLSPRVYEGLHPDESKN